ncbi:putative receptor-like protein kinase At5g39000 [Rutidosis leptorrhynchoides]|uniref:putative receptor-like protein kinase At5g39000 n=1 Tax=Rutidosis leptorrhynchoides TaxID=125765 RepID=UPI003A991BB1
MTFSTSDREEYTPPSSSSVQGSQPCCRFEFDEILLATKNFNESLVIGHGGFGKVYKGIIMIGSSLVKAAIKRLDSMSNQGAAEFWAEVETLSMLRHFNLVSLLGYCNHEREMILVYEYMPNGTLADHLHKLGTPLSWLRRLKICIGAGRGLHYLHTGTGIKVGVIHRDIKSSNILLNESWAAKIADLGLSKISPINQPSTCVDKIVKGTFGYLDPDYYATGMLTRKLDVYAFGVVLLEVLCRKRAVDRSLDEDQWGLAIWIQERIKEGNLRHIIDYDIRGQISPESLKVFVRVAERCLHSNPKQRPTMAEILLSLESALILQDKFNIPFEGFRKTISGRIVDLLPCSFKGKISDIYYDPYRSESKFSSDCKTINETAVSTDLADNTLLPETIENSADSRNRSLVIFEFDDLKKATRNFSLDLFIGRGGFGYVFLGWVDTNTHAPVESSDDGVAVAVKRLSIDSLQGLEEWQSSITI